MKNILWLVSLQIALFFSAWPASASTFTWTGGAGGSNANDFDAKQNWEPLPVGSPTSGDDVLFTSVAPGDSTTPSLETAASVNTLVFDANAAAFTFSGANPLTVMTGIVNDGATEQTFDLEIAGPGSVTQNSGTLNLAGSNSYAGATVISGGTLNANSPLAFGNSSGIELRGGEMNLHADISASSTPLTFGGGALNLNGSESLFGQLLLTEGESILNLGLTGSLTFNGGASWTGGSLLITGWTGDPGSAQIFVSEPISADFLSHVTFEGFEGVTLVNGQLVPVPEPALFAVLSGLGLLAFGVARRRQTGSVTP